MWTAVRRAYAVTAMTLAAGLAVASVASANGPCGADNSPGTACPLTTSPTTVSGSLASSARDDYYVFYAYRRTTLSLTVNNLDDPTCSLNYTCGDVAASLLTRDGGFVETTQPSTPQNDLDFPASLVKTIGKGIYYVDLDGLGSVSAPVPYVLSINAATTPAIHWPPLCEVPKLARNTRLVAVKLELMHGYCLPGRVTRAYSDHTMRGRVIGLKPRVNAVRPWHTKVRIIVSRGRRPAHLPRTRGRR